MFAERAEESIRPRTLDPPPNTHQLIVQRSSGAKSIPNLAIDCDRQADTAAGRSEQSPKGARRLFGLIFLQITRGWKGWKPARRPGQSPPFPDLLIGSAADSPAYLGS